MKKNAIAIACAAVIALVLVLPLGLAGLLRPQAAVTNQGATQDSGQSASAQAVVPEQQETSAEAFSDPSGNPPDEPEYVPGVVLVGIAEGTSIDDVNAKLADLDYIATKHIDESDVVYGYVSLDLAQGVDVSSALQKLDEVAFATEAQPDYIYHALDDVASSDIDTNSAVAEVTTMQAATSEDIMAALDGSSDDDELLSKQWALGAIKAFDAWSSTSARGNHKVTVAVLDSGLDMDHPDFTDKNGGNSNVIGGYSVIQPASRSNIYEDEYGHGTHVAGIIAAYAYNGKGIAGMSYNAYVMPVQVMNSTGDVSSSNAAKGVEYVVDYAAAHPSANVKVINISFGTMSSASGTSDHAGDSQFAAALADAHSKGILVVYAAGNGASRSSSSAYDCYPCDADPQGLGVINVEQNTGSGKTKYTRYESSNFNKLASPASSTKQISAPGGSILSTSIEDDVHIRYYQDESGAKNRHYGYKDGTSMAAPCVSGVAAMVFAANPSLNATDVKQILMDTATDLTPNNSGSETSVGFDRYTGYGMVNAKAAVDAALNSGGGGSSSASSLANATITLNKSSYTYNGSAQKPTVMVKLGYTTLNAGSDYTVVYPSDSTNAGTKTITVKPGTNGKYSGTKTASYTIGKKSASITAKSKTKTYDGTALTASSAGYTASGFVKASDYSSGVSLSGSITDVGSTTARVTFTPSATVKSNYNVTLYSGTLRVTAASLSSVSVSPSSYNYDGKVKNPTVTVYGPNGKRLTSGVDYTIIAPAGRTVVGTYKYSITGKGNYTGSKTASFTISAQRQPLYRLYHKGTGEHHYTLSAYERDYCVANWGWTNEGIAWYCPSTSSTPVYRLYNKSTGLHHYTTSAYERDYCIANWGWTNEGIAWYSDDAKSAPLYRLYHKGTGHHHYTLSAYERDYCIANWGWTNEGIAWYGLK